MPKVAAVPRHYTINLTELEMFHLVRGWRTFCAEWESNDVDEAILSELEDKYEGELGEPPGEPLEEVPT